MISELILILFEVAVMVKHTHRAKSWGGGTIPFTTKIWTHICSFINFSSFLLCRYFYYKLVAYCVCFKMICALRWNIPVILLVYYCSQYCQACLHQSLSETDNHDWDILVLLHYLATASYDWKPECFPLLIQKEQLSIMATQRCRYVSIYLMSTIDTRSRNSWSVRSEQF